MDKADKKALISSLIFGLVLAVFFMPQLNTVPVSAYSTYSSTHWQYCYEFGGTKYKWCTDQDWFVEDGYIFGEDASVDCVIYNPLYYFKGMKAHQVTYENPGDSQWRIATKVQFGAFWFTWNYYMTARAYSSGACQWYDNWV